MAVRPPQGNSGETELIEFGIAALGPHLDGVDFPATAEEILRTAGDPSVPVDASGNAVALSEALSHLPRTTFDSRRELLDALHPVFEQYRTASDGFLSRLRQLLPF